MTYKGDVMLPHVFEEWLSQGLQGYCKDLASFLEQGLNFLNFSL